MDAARWQCLKSLLRNPLRYRATIASNCDEVNVALLFPSLLELARWNTSIKPPLRSSKAMSIISLMDNCGDCCELACSWQPQRQCDSIRPIGLRTMKRTFKFGLSFRRYSGTCRLPDASIVYRHVLFTCIHTKQYIPINTYIHTCIVHRCITKENTIVLFYKWKALHPILLVRHLRFSKTQMTKNNKL